ncbi:MAG: 3'-5' exonuclease [Weeksellaceae bacterium]
MSKIRIIKAVTVGSYFDARYNKRAPNYVTLVDTSGLSEDVVMEKARQKLQKEHKEIVHIISCEDAITSDYQVASGYDDLLSKNWWEVNIIAFDVETTGLSKQNDRIIEIGLSTFNLGSRKFEDPESYFLNDGVPVNEKITDLTGISQDMIDDAPPFAKVASKLYDKFQKADLLVAYNRGFDIGFVMSSFERAGINSLFFPPCICPMELAIRMDLGTPNNKLKTIAEFLEVDGENSHRAGDDAQLAGDVFLALSRRNKFLTRKNCTFRDVLRYFDANRSHISENYENLSF